MLKHGGGSVIFTSTFVGYSCAFPEMAAYAASKSGLIGLMQALAAEFGRRGVRVNSPALPHWSMAAPLSPGAEPASP
jgi:NAD(P)-dependent dehydrogenase (short-subunit alcohol dehydrogenase family)